VNRRYPLLVEVSDDVTGNYGFFPKES